MSDLFNRNHKKTAKGTPPNPTRRATKHKRVEYGLMLRESKRKRDWRRYQGKPVVGGVVV